MGQKRGAIILILSLVFILIFIIGVKYGQRVEKVNKTINYLISIAPTKPVPTTMPVEFKTYQSKGCTLEFLYPSTLSVLKESSNSAKLGKDKQTALEFTCEKLSATPKSKATESVEATASVSFQNKKLVAQTKTENESKQFIFTVRNPTSNKDTHFTVDETLLPLLERTLTFR